MKTLRNILSGFFWTFMIIGLPILLMVALGSFQETVTAQSGMPEPSFIPDLRVGIQNYHYNCTNSRSGCTVTVFEVIDCQHGVILYSDSWNPTPSAVNVGLDAIKEQCR